MNTSINMYEGGTTNNNQATMQNLMNLDDNLRQKSSNIKTYVRVRPLNKMELEFIENGCGFENLRFADSKTIYVLPEKTMYSLDKVYPPEI